MSQLMRLLFVLRKLILQTCMRSHPVGLDIRFLVGPFVYFHTSCLRTAKALARLRRCAGSPEPSLVAYVISTIISWAGSYHVVCVTCDLPRNWTSCLMRVGMGKRGVCSQSHRDSKSLITNHIQKWPIKLYFSG